jgi:excisionase family DNA binding protein
MQITNVSTNPSVCNQYPDVITITDAYKRLLQEFPDVLDVNHVSEIIGVSTKMIYRLLNEGKIKSLKVGRSFKIPKHYLLQYLDTAN